MSVDSLEENGNQTQVGDEEVAIDATPDIQDNKFETVALSVPEKDKSGLKLMTRQSTRLPGNRPIEASHLNVVSTYNSLGAMRPITATEGQRVGSMRISGHRPIYASNLTISETYSVMGNRPVASNEIDDPLLLLDYLD